MLEMFGDIRCPSHLIVIAHSIHWPWIDSKSHNSFLGNKSYRRPKCQITHVLCPAPNYCKRWNEEERRALVTDYVTEALKPKIWGCYQQGSSWARAGILTKVTIILTPTHRGVFPLAIIRQTFRARVRKCLLITVLPIHLNSFGQVEKSQQRLLQVAQYTASKAVTTQ